MPAIFEFDTLEGMSEKLTPDSSVIYEMRALLGERIETRLDTGDVSQLMKQAETQVAKMSAALLKDKKDVGQRLLPGMDKAIMDLRKARRLLKRDHPKASEAVKRAVKSWEGYVDSAYDHLGGDDNKKLNKDLTDLEDLMSAAEAFTKKDSTRARPGWKAGRKVRKRHVPLWDE